MRFIPCLLLAPSLAFAEPPRLTYPLDCPAGMNCYIQNLVDHDVTPEIRDFGCGAMSYDGHNGTDFALPSVEAQRLGVDVLAVAAGRVVGVRDGMIDQLQGTEGAPSVTDRECGNGVVIDHGEGWESQYCHLARGTVSVSTGEEVAPGQKLGQVGLSGATEFPHLHLSLRQDDTVVDPFDSDLDPVCDTDQELSPLWADPVALPRGGFIAMGYADRVPELAEIRAGDANDLRIAATDAALVAWAFVHNGQAGDRIDVRIIGPDGDFLTDRVTLERDQAQLFRAFGRRTPPEGWAEGDYRTTFTLYRDGRILDRINGTIALSR